MMQKKQLLRLSQKLIRVRLNNQSWRIFMKLFEIHSRLGIY